MSVAAILNNAIEFSPANSTISIKLATGDSRQIVIGIKDQGNGVPAELLPHIFERFRFLNNSAVPGLGLPLAHRITKLHCGDIRIESSSTGTLVQLYFPSA